MTPQQLRRKVERIARAYEALGDAAQKLLAGRMCRILRGPYCGRVCKIEKVSWTHQLSVYFEVPYRDGTGFISPYSRKDGRRYYCLTEIELL